MKKLVLSMAALLTLGSAAMAQESKGSNSDNKPQKVKVTPYGFVRNYFNYDSRQTYTVLGGEYNMIPKDEKWNMTEEEAANTGIARYDENSDPTAHFLALTTRVGLKLEGPQVFGAATSGAIEADFGGFGSNNMVLRIRQAWMKLNWKSEMDTKEVLAGQTWHPLVGEIMPECLGMAVGAPFRPHSRTPQLRYIQYYGNYGFTAAAMYQLQYMNQGPNYADGKWGSTASTVFANNAIVPELFLGLNYKTKSTYIQLGADVQTIRPRTFGMISADTDNDPMTPNKDIKVAVDETVVSFTPTLYAQHVAGQFSVKARTMLAENTSHLNMIMSGYGVTAMNADGSWEYTNLRNSTSYIDFAYTFGKEKHMRANLFFGYMKNLGLVDEDANLIAKSAGSDEANTGMVFCKGNYNNIDNMWRVAPSISYNLKHFNLGLEYEYTSVAYGTLMTDGTVSNTHDVANHRICALIKYNF